MSGDTERTPRLPAGADPNLADEWEREQDGAPAYRMFWSKSTHQKIYVRAVGVQHPDGSIAATGDDAPFVYIEHEDFTPADARELAAALIAAADIAEEWLR